MDLASADLRTVRIALAILKLAESSIVKYSSRSELGVEILLFIYG